MDASVLDGIVIGGAGGAIAGLTVWLAQFAQTMILDCRDKGRAYRWLRANTKTKPVSSFGQPEPSRAGRT